MLYHCVRRIDAQQSCLLLKIDATCGPHPPLDAPSHLTIPMSDSIPSPIDDISQQIRTNYMGLACFTILIWDHVDTFTTEVEYIWKGKKSPLSCLFLVNRYLTPLGFIVNLFAYLSPVWTSDTCRRFIRFEGAMTMIGIHVVGLMMLFRIYALYHSRKRVVAGVVFLLLVQAGVNAWLLTQGEPVVHNPVSGVRACTMIFPPRISVAASSSAWLPLLYDTVIMTLTVIRLYPSIRNQHPSFVVRRLFEDGLVYYSVILAVNVTLAVMIVGARPGLKNITAQLELILTVAMMSRITLNLKESMHRGSVIDLGQPTRLSKLSFATPPTVHLRTTMYSSSNSMTSMPIPSTPPQRGITSCSFSVESPLQRPNTVHHQGKPYVPPDGW